MAKRPENKPTDPAAADEPGDKPGDTPEDKTRGKARRKAGPAPGLAQGRAQGRMPGRAQGRAQGSASDHAGAPLEGRGPALNARGAAPVKRGIGGALGPTVAADAARGGYLAGQFLIAMPSMGDPRFARTLVYLCLHSEEGALGIVVNRPLEGLSFAELLRQLHIEPAPPSRDMRMHRGGPVEAGRGFVLHSADWVQDSSLRVSDTVALTASVEILKEIALGRGPEKGILALGYAGWGPGQLDREIQENAWLSAPADAALLFDAALATKWQRALAKIGVDPAWLSGAAGHA